MNILNKLHIIGRGVKYATAAPSQLALATRGTTCFSSPGLSRSSSGSLNFVTKIGRRQIHSSSASNTGGILDEEAVADLFDQYAQNRCLIKEPGKLRQQKSLDLNDLRKLLEGIGKHADDEELKQLFQVADIDGNGVIDSKEFLENADTFLADSPARIIIVLGGPGSGKGVLSQRLQEECGVVHLSSGDLLRQEVALGTNLGKMVKDIMKRGELVSSAVMVALMKKRMRDHPGKRVLLDGFPRSPENAKDLVTLCGKPELALHLVCDDTILMERIMMRGLKSEKKSESDDGNDEKKSERRVDDNFFAALKRLRTYHQYHHTTLEWLRSQHVPIINLDCEGNAESVWMQLVAIGRLMRPAVKLNTKLALFAEQNKKEGNELDNKAATG